MAILPESGHAKFLKFLDALNHPYFHHKTKLELMTNCKTFLKSENTEKWPFCLSPDIKFKFLEINKPSLFSSEYQIRVPDQIWPKKVHF